MTNSGVLGAFEIPAFMIGVIQANADLSAKQFYAVEVIAATGSGLTGSAIALPAATGNPVLGILQNAPLLGEAAEVMAEGISKGICGDTVSVGDVLMAQDTGKWIKATTGKYGRALALSAGIASDLIPMYLMSSGKV